MRPLRRQPRATLPTLLLGRLLILAALAAALPVLAAADDLNPSALERLVKEPVTTSATGKPQRAGDAPVAMDIITAEQIRRSGAHDIPGVLARYTTLDVIRFTPDDYAVGVRGYATPNVPRLLVLVDGRQVYLDDYGRTIWSAIPVQLSEIRQIEVVRGPNSALFGFNAAAGVINILTYNPAHDRVSNLVLRGGTGAYGEVSGVATTPLPGDGGLRISTGLRRQDPFWRGLTDVDQRVSPRNAQLAGTARFGLGPDVRVGLDASYAAATTGQRDFAFSTRQELEVWSLRGRVSAETGLGVLAASVYHNGLGLRVGGTPATQQGVTTIELSDTIKPGPAHTLRPFLQYRQNALQQSDDWRLSGNLVTGQSARVGYRVASAGGMWNWAIADGLEWTAAVRYDQLWLHGAGYDGPGQPFSDAEYDRRGFGTLAWNAGLVWKASPADTVRLSVARGIQPPTLLDLGARIGSRAVVLAGSPFAPITVVDDYEIGYRRRLEPLATDIELTAFTQANRAMTSTLGAYPTLWPPAVAAPTIVPVSLGTSHVTGLEIGTTTRLGPELEVGLKYRGAFTGGRLMPAYIEYQRASPRHIAIAHVGWTHGRWEADLFTRYASSAAGYRFSGTGSGLVLVKDYVTASARLAWRVTPKLTMALEGEDVLQAYQAQSIGSLVERRIYLSLRADF
ncbi:TonB-dependent receptor plug domain-containing protein [Rhodovastum atsumiense]|uniref:TonB-dependent receptor plug domain-containing protein n=1 Tax=Rhodovastum atsumiense TaxID=504468 RepID=A0A5M6IMX2_9PROT|nr:TonB-dependent receptor [Rhodovastum atsumiense]KAA5609219.1 TonB-dependent receptor plug domain-containing protein [Rhodovastum atsumiense]CAH2603944.1 TonB-dependent receptor plug domain-containing protein [Rhodovastum atsumiense]